jgi:hypothetical protein
MLKYLIDVINQLHHRQESLCMDYTSFKADKRKAQVRNHVKLLLVHQ